MVRAGVQVRAVVRVVRPLDRTNYSVQRAIPKLVHVLILVTGSLFSDEYSGLTVTVTLTLTGTLTPTPTLTGSLFGHCSSCGQVGVQP